jgi:hypothetical protein
MGLHYGPDGVLSESVDLEDTLAHRLPEPFYARRPVVVDYAAP